jgi:hypothetical protein
MIREDKIKIQVRDLITELSHRLNRTILHSDAKKHIEAYISTYSGADSAEFLNTLFIQKESIRYIHDIFGIFFSSSILFDELNDFLVQEAKELYHGGKIEYGNYLGLIESFIRHEPTLIVIFKDEIIRELEKPNGRFFDRINEICAIKPSLVTQFIPNCLVALKNAGNDVYCIHGVIRFFSVLSKTHMELTTIPTFISYLSHILESPDKYEEYLINTCLEYLQNIAKRRVEIIKDLWNILCNFINVTNKAKVQAVMVIGSIAFQDNSKIKEILPILIYIIEHDIENYSITATLDVIRLLATRAPVQMQELIPYLQRLKNYPSADIVFKARDAIREINGEVTVALVRSKKQREDRTGINVFMSYSTQDAKLFNLPDIVKAIGGINGIQNVFYWEKSAEDDIISYMNEHLGDSEIFILFCTPNALASGPVELEWQAALKLGKQIIPVFIDPEHIPTLLTSKIGIKYDMTNHYQSVIFLQEEIRRRMEFIG